MAARKPNPRRKNGHRRNQIRRRVLAASDVCAICGRVVDKTLQTPHPMSAEVDEIIPVSLGGDPLDIENVQLAHRACNQRKGARVLGHREGSVSSPQIEASEFW